MILKQYETNNVLTSTCQSNLTHIIIDYVLSKKQKLNSQDFDDIARTIQKLFTSENVVSNLNNLQNP